MLESQSHQLSALDLDSSLVSKRKLSQKLAYCVEAQDLVNGPKKTKTALFVTSLTKK